MCMCCHAPDSGLFEQQVRGAQAWIDMAKLYPARSSVVAPRDAATLQDAMVVDSSTELRCSIPLLLHQWSAQASSNAAADGRYG